MLVLSHAQELPSSVEFKKKVNLIQVPVIVRDKSGHAVNNLNVDEVSVYDNGQLQKIARFRYLQADGQDVGTGASLIAQQPKSTLVERAEDLHLRVVIPQLQFGSRLQAFAGLKKALQQGLLGSVNVSMVDDSSRRTLPFTRDRDSIIHGLERMQGIKVNPCDMGPWAVVAGDRLSQMRSMPGRKFMLIFSDGPELDPQCVKRGAFGSVNSPTLLVELALNSNVAVYPIDPRGAAPVIPGGDASSEQYFGPDEKAPSLPGTINMTLSGELSARRMERSVLLEVAGVTGGRVPLDVNDAFRMMHEDSSYYEVDYYLPNLKTDGAFHRIEIKLRRSGLHELAKEGYQAPAIRWLTK